MKKLIATMFGLSLLALWSFGSEFVSSSSSDQMDSHVLVDCGECDKDHGDDEDESVTRALANCGECDKDQGDDEEESVTRALANCGECDKDQGDDDDDEEESFV